MEEELKKAKTLLALLKCQMTSDEFEKIKKAKSPEELREVLIQIRDSKGATERTCELCGRKFKRIEDGLLDLQIGSKTICSVCFFKKRRDK